MLMCFKIKKKALKSEIRSTVSAMRSTCNNTAYAINFKLGETPVIFIHFNLSTFKFHIEVYYANK